MSARRCDALRLALVPVNVCELVDAPPKRPAPRETYDLGEAQRLLAAARSERLEALCLLEIATGMRLGELRGLRWRYVDLESGSLQVFATLQRTAREGGDSGLRARPGSSASQSRRAHAAGSRFPRRSWSPSTRIAPANSRKVSPPEPHGRMARRVKTSEDDLVFCNEVGAALTPRTSHASPTGAF